jgi:hypothetical protein
MVALTAVMQQNAVTAIFSYSEADGIHRPVCGNSSALAGIAKIAEIS